MTCILQRTGFLNKGPLSSSRAIYKSVLHVIQNVWHGQGFSWTFERYTIHLKLVALEVLSKKTFFKEFEKSKFQTYWENAHIRSVSFIEPIVALNQINQQHHKRSLSFVRIKVPKWSKSYLVCYKWRSDS